MSDDSSNLSLRGTKAAQQNNIQHRERPHPWDQRYLKTCIISDCREPTYYDGMIYYTCCVACLKKTQLGPFHKGNSRLRKKAEADLQAYRDTIKDNLPTINHQEIQIDSGDL